MPRYALRLEFAGRGWSGTALQPNSGQTLQAALNAALPVANQGQAAWFTCCGRLDAGVIAHAFTGHCDLSRDWPAASLIRLLNQHLPQAIVVTAIARVDEHWHARCSATGKIYEYRLFERQVPSPLLDQVWWQRRLLHPERLQDYAQRLLGRHDLSGFACLRHDPSDARDATRLIHAADWTSEPHAGGTLHRFRIHGQGFLYKQIRGIVGALVAVANDRNGAARRRFAACMSAGRASRHRAGDIAPASGLLLDRVCYEPAPNWQEAT